MSVAKVSEISACSPDSFEAACEVGLARANKTLKNITGAWISELKVNVEDGKISTYQVNMKVTFVLDD